jgi:hypothetical protein
MAHPQDAFECRAGIGEMRVEVLYFEGCPTYQTTETPLREILVGRIFKLRFTSYGWTPRRRPNGSASLVAHPYG